MRKLLIILLLLPLFLFGQSPFKIGTGMFVGNGKVYVYDFPADTIMYPNQLDSLSLWYRVGWSNFTVRIATDTFLSQWNDLSGNGNHARCGVAGQQPKWKGANGINGSGAVLFDGNNDSLQLTDIDTLGEFTIIALIQSSADGLLLRHTVDCPGEAPCVNNQFRIRYLSDVYININDWTHGSLTDIQMSTSAISAGVNDYFALTIIKEERFTAGNHYDSVKVWEDNTLILADEQVTSITSNQVLTIASIGHSAVSFDGNIVELMVFDGNLSDAEREGIINYFIFRYGAW